MTLYEIYEFVWKGNMLKICNQRVPYIWPFHFGVSGIPNLQTNPYYQLLAPFCVAKKNSPAWHLRISSIKHQWLLSELPMSRLALADFTNQNGEFIRKNDEFHQQKLWFQRQKSWEKWNMNKWVNGLASVNIYRKLPAVYHQTWHFPLQFPNLFFIQFLEQEFCNLRTNNKSEHIQRFKMILRSFHKPPLSATELIPATNYI